MKFEVISKYRISGALLISFLCTVTPAVFASEADNAELDPALVFAARGDVVLTQTEMDGAFTGIPQPARLAYIRDGNKVDQLVISLLQRKAVAADAKKSGFDLDPVIAARVQLAAEKELAEAWLQNMIETAPEADYAELGRENYLADPDSYRTEVVLDVSHILIGTDTRSDAEAKLLAEQLREQLTTDPSKFGEMVKEYSDDPAKTANGGRYTEVSKGQMVESFEQAAFAMEEPGEISTPVKTDYGYHLIRLNGKAGGEVPEFEQVQAEAQQRARVTHLRNIRENYMKKLANDPIVIPDGAVEIMAKRYFGQDLELAPTFQE